MRTSKFSACTVLISMLFGTVVRAQTPAKGKPSTASKTANAAKSISALAEEARKYRLLLDDVDVTDPDIRQAAYEKWVAVTCQGKSLHLQQLMGGADAALGASVVSACTKRLMAEAPAPIPPARTASAGPPCSVVPGLPTVNGTNTKYGYEIQCGAGVTPSAMAISTAQAQPAITDAQGKAFAQGFAAALGIPFPAYDPAKSTVSFAFPAGATPHRFELLVPTTSTVPTSATYYIASAGTDVTTCFSSSPPSGCSIGAIRVPVPAPKPPTTCPNEIVDSALDSPKLDPVDVTTEPVTGQLPKPKSGAFQPGKVQLCSKGKLLGPAAPVSTTDGKFSVTPLPRVTSGDQITAQFTNASGISGPASAAAVVGSCSQAVGQGTAPTLSPSTDSTTGKVTYSGTLPKATSGTVRICVDDLPNGDTATIGKDGTFTPVLSKDPKAGSIVVAQSVSGTAPKQQYGPLSNEVVVGMCSDVPEEGDTSTKPTLNTVTTSSNSFSGTIPGAKPGTKVRICVGDTPSGAQDATAVVKENGAFKGLFANPPKAGQFVTAQEITSAPGSPRKYGLMGPAEVVRGFRYSSLFGSFIAGVEQSGYSSEITNTNFFVSAYLRSSYLPLGCQASSKPPSERCPNSLKPPSPVALALWGRTRLLSAPQPSTQNIVSVLTDPTGQISQSNFSKVGQVIDYTIGPELRIAQRDSSDGQTTRISLFAALGATTPLTADSVTLTYNAPGPNTPECATLVNRYPPNPSKGIAGLYPGPLGADGLQTTCIINPATKAAYQYVVFTNQNRSNFLGKYGGGLRLTHVYPAKGQGSPYDGTIDLGIGQDQTITGGTFHGAVFKIDGQYPFAYGPMSFIYFFGSASIRLSGNQNYAPLILTVPTGSMTPTVPSATVTVLSTQQPNRDFYRIGIGLNLLDVFSKLKSGPTSSTTPTTATGGANTAAAASK